MKLFPAFFLFLLASLPVQAVVAPLPDDPACNADDRRFMVRANELARAAAAHGNYPFGALLVKDGKIILEYENAIYTTRDVTQHAETGLVGKATQRFGAETLAACTLYASTEPCTMCCGAIRWAGIKRVVYGVSTAGLMKVVNSVLPPEPSVANPPPSLDSREVFARTAPSVTVKGPLLETEGLAIHEAYWAHDPVILKLTAKVAK